MAINYKCILAYGLTDEQLDKIQKRRLKGKVSKDKNSVARIIDLLCNNDM